MKKLLFFSLILGFIFSPFPFSAKGQDDTEMAWAQHVKQALDNRPSNLNESEAWEILIGKKNESSIYRKEKIEFKNFYFLKRESVSENIYLRSKTSSLDGWWYEKTLSFDPGVWEINWPFSICILVSTIILFWSIFFSKNFFLKHKQNIKNQNTLDPNVVIEIIFGIVFFLIMAGVIFYFKFLSANNPLLENLK